MACGEFKLQFEPDMLATHADLDPNSDEWEDLEENHGEIYVEWDTDCGGIYIDKIISDEREIKFEELTMKTQQSLLNMAHNDYEDKQPPNRWNRWR